MPFTLLSPRRLLSATSGREYLDCVRDLYLAIRAVTGCRVIADSSKSPMYAAILGLIPEIELTLVHLIRDSKAVAYSWAYRKPDPGDSLLPMDIVKSSILWNLWNGAAEWLGLQNGSRYLRLRYEDFVQDPQAALRAILVLLKEDVSLPHFRSVHSLILQPTHTVKGNPGRFRIGKVDILPDERWVTGLPWAERYVVDAISFPLLLRYGYRW